MKTPLDIYDDLYGSMCATNGIEAIQCKHCIVGALTEAMEEVREECAQVADAYAVALENNAGCSQYSVIAARESARRVRSVPVPR